MARLHTAHRLWLIPFVFILLLSFSGCSGENYRYGSYTFSPIDGGSEYVVTSEGERKGGVIANVNNALPHENKCIEAAVQEPSSGSTKSSDIGILIGFLMIILGLFHLLAPAKAWKLEIGWQFKDAEPSKAALMFHRVIGGLLIIGAIVVIVIFRL